jgi:hypothetical protein
VEIVSQQSEGNLLSEENLYEMLAFLFSSAHLLVNEPHLYGTIRLLDAASRLMGFALDSGELEDEQFLGELKEDLDQRKFLLVSDEDAYCEYLGELTLTIAREMKRRASAQEGAL